MQRFDRHEGINDTLSNIVKDAGAHYSIHVSPAAGEKKLRPDGQATINGVTTYFDVSGTDPRSENTVKHAATTTGHAAQQREKQKTNKYKSYATTGRHENFVPFVFETFGHWGKQAEKFLKKLAEFAEPDPVAAAARLAYWWKLLSVALVRGNFTMIRAAAGHLDTDRLGRKVNNKRRGINYGANLPVGYASAAAMRANAQPWITDQ